MTGLIPTAAAASMIGVVGKQKRVDTPSFFKISAMTFMTSIGRSSRRIALLDEIECSSNRGERQPEGRKPAANVPAAPCNAGSRTDRHPQNHPDQANNICISVTYGIHS